MEATPKGISPKRKERKPKTFFFRAWMIGQLRRIFRRYPPFYQVRNTVKEEYSVLSKTGKPMRRVRFTCALCKEKHSNSNIVVDHINPVIDPKVGFPLLPDGTDDWIRYIARLFCSIENLQVLCRACHDTKSGKEAKVRAKVRKKHKALVDKT
jgi:5-methylcytosine-specific restriction endonuclease McrA